MSTELWKTLPGWLGYYEVSDQGRVRSLDRSVPTTSGWSTFRRGMMLKQYRDDLGYLSINLARGGKRKNRSVHQLVLESFVGPKPFPDAVCRHLDGDPSNNMLSNLKWGTLSENMYDRVRHGTHNDANKTHCPRGHEYIAANCAPWALKRGSRTCLACSRARAYCMKYDLMDQIQSIADDRFAAISSMAV